MNEKPTKKYRYCNHHHEIGDRHEIVDFGDEQIMKEASTRLVCTMKKVSLIQAKEVYEKAHEEYVRLLQEEINIVNKAKHHLPSHSHILMIKLRKKGETYRAIGERFGVSAQRVEQIYKKYNYE